MLTILFSLAVLWALQALIKHRTAAAVAAVFLLVSLVSRTLSLVYVDLAGPFFSEQLGVMVGGAPSMPLFAVSILLLMASLAYAFRPEVLAKVRPLPCPPGKRNYLSGNVAFVVAAIFVAALYWNMLSTGIVPLFSGIDRLEYKAIAGPLHGWLMEFGFLLAGTLGCFMCTPRLYARDFDLRFLALYVLVMIYFALTGNRYSSFYSFTSFFLLPLASLPALASVGKLPRPPVRTLLYRLIVSRSASLIGFGAGALIIVGLVLNSVINVRGYNDPEGQLIQRILIQPVELWCVTWNDLGSFSIGTLSESWQGLFINPIDPTRNTSIQLLMLKNLGQDRTVELLGQGTQYAGGYSEVLFELFGPWFALPAALIFSVPTAILLRLTILAVCERRLLTAFMSLYVFYGFSLLYIGGMLNFLAVWTFWVKIAVLFLANFLERRQHAIALRAFDQLPSDHYQ